MKTTHRGSCHCGDVKFECELDLAPAEERSPPELPGPWWTTSFRCNCSYCEKTRFWKAFVRAQDFRLLSARDALSEYRFGEQAVRHCFCKRCGVQTFGNASFEQMGGEFYAVNVACLDDASPSDLARVPIAYEDGASDAWDRPPTETRYL